MLNVPAKHCWDGLWRGPCEHSFGEGVSKEALSYSVSHSPGGSRLLTVDLLVKLTNMGMLLSFS